LAGLQTSEAVADVVSSNSGGMRSEITEGIWIERMQFHMHFISKDREKGAHRRMKRTHAGFTLIELLIVVAIIAILAAIAVPNFLEAQTRAKVGRVYADFRSLATALEAYRTDNADYPRSHTGAGGDFIEPPDMRMRPLTTPVPYITKPLASSPFKPPGQADYWATYYQYSTTKGLLTWNRYGGQNGEGNAQLNGFYRKAAGQQKNLAAHPERFSQGPAWHIMDKGPDEFFFFHWVNPTWAGGPTERGISSPIAGNWNASVEWYDPTNGTISLGEIIRSQMKSSFQ
jgi:type II secretion system protein G